MESIQAFATLYGKEFTWDIKADCMGMARTQVAEHIIGNLGLPLTVQQYLDQTVERNNRLFSTARLLPDTERLYTTATQALATPHGKEYTWEVKVQCMGRKRPEVAQHVIATLGLPLTTQQFLDQIAEHYNRLLPTAQSLPGAERLVRHLHKHGVPIAIASGGAKDSYDLKTTNHKEFMSLFKHTVLASSDPEVKNGKPAPDVFLVCAGRFPDNPDPAKCLVFEDAPNGVTSGVAAGMQVVMVPDPRLKPEMTKGATQVLPSLENFKPEDFGLPPYDD